MINKKRLLILIAGVLFLLTIAIWGIIVVRNDSFPAFFQTSDKEKPKLSGVKNLTFDGQTALDFYSHLNISDNGNDKPQIIVEGAYDLAVNGIYNLKYIIMDASGNETVENFTLTVDIEKSTPENLTSYKTTTRKGYKLEVINGLAYVDRHLIANKSYSVPKDYNPQDMVELKKGQKVLKEVQAPFLELVADASAIGLNIYNSTCYRSYSFQNTLYTNYVKRDGKEAADTYSARPGYSEHQTGLAIDVNTVNNDFHDTPEAKWLNENCHKYGFVIRYPKGKENITGYQYESWHIRYVGKELAEKLYNNGDWITMEEYFGLTSEYGK